jgi:hypothetical protein
LSQHELLFGQGPIEVSFWIVGFSGGKKKKERVGGGGEEEEEEGGSLKFLGKNLGTPNETFKT